MKEKEIIAKIENDLKLQLKQAKKESPREMDSKWSFLTSTEPKKFINKDLTVNVNAIRSFRKFCVFIPDDPHFKPYIFNLRNWISGGRRGARKLLKENHELIKRLNLLNLLKKYPCNTVGDANVFRYKGYEYTYRWIRHIIFLSVLKQVLENKLDSDFISLDIGSSYGIFSYLVKKDFNQSKHILLDFPEQLVLAHYYLGMSFPDARIASYQELSEQKYIDRDFINKYDFILLPWFFYKKISPNSLDLVTNFASLGEMRREWFNYYIESEPFLSTPFFYTVNRFQSAPTYDTDLTILDYPLQKFNKLHFRISPYFSHTYPRKNLFFYRKVIYSSQYFEFIGERW